MIGGCTLVEVKTLDSTPEPAQKKIASYLLISGDEAILIDTGPKTAWRVLEPQIESEGVALKHIIVTHIHLDHAGAAATIARSLGSVEKVFVHPRGSKHLVNPEKLWAASKQLLGSFADYFGKPDLLPSNKVVVPSDGEILELLGGVRLRIIYTPGHASHHMSILEEDSGLLFSGDSAGISMYDDDGEVRLDFPTTPPPFKPKEYLESLDKMARLEPKSIAFGHYGVLNGEAVEFLKRHKKEVIRWIRVAVEYASRGGGDPDELARILVNSLPSAARAARARSPIISEFMFRGTVLGLLDMAVRGEGRGV